ncbi:uncharacterized protein LOC111134265 isoform X6 [Crassostrea virginica]
MTSSVFLERNLRDLPMIDRGRRGDPFSGKKAKDQQDGTFLVSISTKKPMGVPEARDPSQSSAPRLIRRRLNFLDSDDDFNPNPVFDFTDKMAAFREILKKDSERDAERYKKMGGDRYFGKTEREISTDKKKEGRDNDAGFPRSREARRLLQRLANEKLTRSDQPRQYLECVIDSSSKQEKRMETPKRQSKSDDYLDKFLPERTNAKTSSSQKKGSRFPNNAALDKTPRKEISTPQLTDRNIPLYPENLLQEPDLLMNDNMSLTSTVSRKTGKGSIQSNVPHYHPSYVSPKEAPSESVKSQSKQPNLKGLGLCEGVRTGEVIITKSRMGKTTPTHTKSTSQSACKEKGRALTLEDLSTHPNNNRSKRKKHRERRSDKSEGKLRRDRTEIEEDLDISDSSKENDKISGKANRKVNKDQMAQGESSAEAPRVEGLQGGDQQYNQTARKPVFGPRHPETEGEARRGNLDGVWRPPEGSVSGSVRSIGSQSSTIMAVELLRKLYNVDPRTRQDLILKAKCFRRWLKNVQSMQSIDERNPYAQSGPESAEAFHRRRVQKDFFLKWKKMAADRVMIRAADNLHCLHSLKKGMNAFKWAINRSKIMVDIYQNKLKGILVTATFFKWKELAIKSRQERMQKAFNEWRYFTEEAQKNNLKLQKVRYMQESMDRKLLIRMMHTWQKRFQIKVKENSAHNHFRRRVMTHTLTAWRIYTLESKEKQKREEIARNLYKERLQSKIFTCMIILYRKLCLAKLHYKNHSLNKMLHEWRRAAAISREEYDQSLAQSQEHYQRNQLRHCFSNWHDLYLTERAMTATNQKLTRNAFIIWKTSWQHQVHYREEIHARIRHKILSTSLTCWRENVAVLKRRREAAVVYLQRVLVRNSLLGWKEYTQHKKQLSTKMAFLRTIQRSLTNRLNIKMQQRIMSHWRDHMEKRLNLRQAQTFWSNTCARKSVVQWKKFCHKRALLRLLNDTEPIRKQNLLNRMFQKWLSFKERIESENEEVSETRGILERSQLARRFYHWKAEALLKLRVRPLVHQRQARLLSESFRAWHSLVQQKKECRRNKAVFSKITLGKLFCKWRQQFSLRAVERDVRQRVKTSFVRRCLIGWRKVIQRKRAALLFHNQQLVKQTFMEWRYKAIHQMKERLATKEEQEYNSWLLKSYFNSWWSNAQQQRRQREDILNRAQESRTTQQIISCFGFWRHHLRATIVAREHQRMLQKRLMTRVIVEWHSVVERSMKRAVQEFAVRIGLQAPEDISEEGLNYSEDSDLIRPLPVKPEETSERLQLLTDMMMAGSENTSGIHSPVASSTLGTPMKRLSSPALSRISLDLDKSIGEGQDYKLTLANTSFIDARFEMEQAVKTERMKILVTTAVQRIQFWPISIIFGNWRNHTLHQKELQSLLKQATEVIQMLKVKCAFRMWKGMCRRKTQSRNFREECLKRHVLEALQENKRKMKYKKQLSSLAFGYHSLTVFRKIFPVWFEKAQELRHTRCVVHIWNTQTEEEQALVPIEDTLHSRLSTKTLRKCLAVWHLKFLQIDRLRKTYHKIIQQRFFDVWREWAQRKAQLRRDSKKFNNHRIQSLAFHMWTIRRKQMVVIEEKVKNSQTQNLRLFIQNWHRWTIENKQKKITHDIVMRNHQRSLVLRTFVTWRDQAEKCRLMARRCQQRLMIRILREWEEVTIWKKEMKQKALSFQVKSYTKQVIRMFKEWHSKYLEHVQQHEEHEAYIRRRVLEYGRHWKKQTQKARGRQLHCVLRNRQVASCFAKWKYAFERNLERENQLNKYIVRKNRKILETYLDDWKMRLLSNQATRLFNVKLLRALFCEWHNFASNSNQRKHNLAVYQRALEQRSLKSYFHYWYSLTQVQNDIKKHCHLKIQIRVLREWHLYAQRRRQLATLGSVLSKYVQRETLKRVWYTFKVQADYCVNLNDTATKVLAEKNGRCMQRALTVWRKRLNDIIAGRCYHHLLARRTVRQWKCFVKKRKEEKEIEKQNTEKASRHYSQHICKIAFRALYNEVRVKHQLQVHVLRIQKKYGGIWKHKVDMVFTAFCVEEERLLSQSWKVWRLAFARQQAARKVTVYNERQILSQTFVAWKEVCFERKEKVRSVGFYLPSSEPPVYKASQLPTPVNRYQSKGSRKSQA